MPSQRPPHDEPSLAQAGRPPCGAPVAGVQVPSAPVLSQASHWPSHADSQHTPSTHSAESHMRSREHERPLGSWVTHTPAEQYAPSLQSSSSLQSPLQAVAPHMKGSQDCVRASGQRPVPLQNSAMVATPSAQLPARHEVVADG